MGYILHLRQIRAPKQQMTDFRNCYRVLTLSSTSDDRFYPPFQFSSFLLAAASPSCNDRYPCSVSYHSRGKLIITITVAPQRQHVQRGCGPPFSRSLFRSIARKKRMMLVGGNNYLVIHIMLAYPN